MDLAPLLLTLLAAAPAPDAGGTDAALVARGAYLARLGDCVECHTAPGGAPLAGGRALATPFGAIRTANVTPDLRTGIGRYTLEEFDGAVRGGVRRDGANLYPAMPYPSFAKVTDDDLRALYAWAMHGVTPVDRPSAPADLRWPFSMRWGLSLWKWAFLDAEPFRPDPAKDAAWNRGAYLVQGLGHCGACHTARGVGFQEKATSERGSGGARYLAGATMDDWRAIDLRSLGTVEDLVEALRAGQSRLGAASGSMVEVIHGSTQHFSDADRVAIATYLASLPRAGAAPAAPAAARVETAAAPDGLFTTRGGLGYVQFCSTCHRRDGAGVAGIFPPLAGNPSVDERDPATLVHVALTGWRTAETAATPRTWAMPAYARLSDAELAEILSFVRASWGGARAALAPADVAAARARLAAPAKPPPGFEPPRFADLLAAPNAAQLVRGMRLHLETKALLPAHVGASASCASCHLAAGTVADGSPFVGVAAAFPGYNPRAGRVISLADRINGCFKRSMNGKPLAASAPELADMLAYFEWMRRGATPDARIPGRGVGKVDEAIRPDAANGERVYAAQCAACHGAHGEGLRRADGEVVYPPVWGDDAFNLGAGVARTYTAAAFVRANMPIGARDRFPLAQGGLSDQEAVDVAAYFSHQPRPDFPEKALDWPRDKKPADARY